MNVKQAKQLDFPMLLEKLGYFPVQGGIKKGGSEIWYQSPFAQDDKTPSFHLTKGKKVAWVFKCFSTDKEGTIIDFVIAHDGCPARDVPSALAFLREKFPGALFEHGQRPSSTPLFSFHQQTEKSATVTNPALAADRDLEYISDLPLKSGRLLAYLQESRKIPAHIAQSYLRLVRYRNLKNGKEYYAIGMLNRAGGFEIRAGSAAYSFKSALKARDISIFNASPASDTALVFEGMMDFLSYLAMQGRGAFPFDAIVMHSVNSFRRTVDYMREMGYAQVFTFLDNDGAGHRCSKQFETEMPGLSVSLSFQFHPHKDVNEAWQKGLRLSALPDHSDNCLTCPRP